MICDAGAVVICLFPFVDGPVVKSRPAVVLSTSSFNASEGATVLIMITSAARSRRPSDYGVIHWQEAGLKTPCFVRMKIFTADNALIGQNIGTLSALDWRAVQTSVAASLSLGTQRN
jgi:mRNA interferase MazF